MAVSYRPREGYELHPLSDVALATGGLLSSP